VGLLDFLKRTHIPHVDVVSNDSAYDATTVGTIDIPDKLTDTNAFTLANTVAEIYFPIDFIADRISKLRFFIADKNGTEIGKTELNRFITDINPLYSFSELVYQFVFSYLADGNVIKYLGVPSALGKATVNNITRLDILEPSLVDLREYDNISILDVNSLNELIYTAKYYDAGVNGKSLIVDNLSITNIDSTRRATASTYSGRVGSLLLSKSPLFKCYRSVNNLLATYSARYNVYVNNGAAGYLVRKTGAGNVLGDIADGLTRKEMIKDINDRNGITGARNLWGISSVPMEFINTLADIQKLMPFEETLEDSIKIAGVFQIPPELVPRKDQSTFSNKNTSERSVWENAIMSISDMVAEDLTKTFFIDKTGNKIMCDYSTVSSLNESEKDAADSIKSKVETYGKLYNDGIITLNEYLRQVEQPEINGGDRLISEITTQPPAIKFGVGGTQSLQAILVDPNLTDTQKTNTLIVLFGIPEADAKLMLKR
jgi:hypothetical protein